MQEEHAQILKAFSDHSKGVADVLNVFADRESRILLSKLAGPNSPLRADGLPYSGSEGSKLSNLIKLKALVNLGLVEEKEIHEGEKTVTEYSATKRARDIMSNL